MDKNWIRNLLMKKINMGCGWRDFGSDWIHIDGGEYEHLDYKSGVKNLPQFEDNSIDLIYASHVIEYFDRFEIISILKEWRRVLKPGATLRLAVPNFAVLSKLYLSGKIELKNVLGPLYGKMTMDENTIYHKTTYDFKDLKTMLIDNGFCDAKIYDWRDTDHAQFDDHSQAYIPHMDKENGTLISLNIECKNEL